MRIKVNLKMLGELGLGGVGVFYNLRGAENAVHAVIALKSYPGYLFELDHDVPVKEFLLSFPKAQQAEFS